MAFSVHGCEGVKLGEEMLCSRFYGRRNLNPFLFFPILTYGPCSPAHGRRSRVLGLLPSPSPAPRDRSTPPRHAQGTHQGLSNNLVERERETGRQQGQKVLHNLYPPRQSGGILAKTPKMTSPRGQPDLSQHRWLSGGGFGHAKRAPHLWGLGTSPMLLGEHPCVTPAPRPTGPYGNAARGRVG